jgi:calcineurin-like phosphoesterase family protein
MSEVYFTADSHFGHGRIIELGHRPFGSVEEMDSTMVERWNARVRPGDLVYHLGDFALCHPTRARELFEALAGEKHLLVGNHDHSATRKLPWCSVHELRRITVWRPSIDPLDEPGTEIAVKVVLCHYPLMTWQCADGGAIHLHGHCHGNLTPSDQPRLDVGVDVRDFRPLSLAEVLDLIGDRRYRPVDHHEVSTVSA